MATMAEETRNRLEELAYQQGRRDADVDGRLLGHERRLNAINGSISRHAENAEKLRQTVDERFRSLDDKLDELIAAQTARDAVDQDRDRQHDRASQRQFSRRTIVIAFCTVAVMFAALIVSVLALALNVH